MSRSSRAGMLAGAAVALALAAALVLVARDARAWSDAIRDGDVRFQVAPRRVAWQVDERAPFDLARRTLAIDDDLAVRRAFRLFQLARTPASGFRAGEERDALRVRSQIALAQLAREERSRARRGTAANLIALLTFDEAVGDQQNAVALLRRSVVELRRAIRLHPRSEEAKYNLELILRLSQPGSQREREQLGLFGGGQGVGAGVSAPGRGY